MSQPRKTFGPVVLLGLASAGLAAVAGSRAWVRLAGSAADSANAAVSSAITVSAPGEMPLAAALSLVTLACWGVVLVTRQKVRRAVAGLGALAALGLLATTISAPFTLPASFRSAMADLLGPNVDVDTTFTGWYAVALASAVISMLATAAAVRLTPTWPEMGSRYDAPTGDSGESALKEPEGNLEIWKALDEGHDPTGTERPLN